MSPYCAMNANPISNIDPDGDEPVLAAIAIGAAVGVFSNGLSNAYNGDGFFKGAGQAAVWGGIGAGAASGIGSVFNAAGNFGHEAARAGAHALSGGIQSSLQGGSFGQGFLSGGISSGLSSGASALNFGDAGMIGVAGLGGGIGSAIGGGNFFEGLGQGIAVGAFNHAAHSLFDPTDPLKANLKASKSLEEWAEYYGGTGYFDIAYDGTELLESKSGGGSHRYVRDPKTGNVIDMKHFLKVGRWGRTVGNSVEVFQKANGLYGSAHHPQDYFSNELGYKFYNSVKVKIWRQEYARVYKGGFVNAVVNFLNNQ